jgi:hypothetical protein
MKFIDNANEYFKDFSKDDLFDLFQNIEEKVCDLDLGLDIDKNFNLIETLSSFKHNSDFIMHMYENDNQNFVAAIIYNNCYLQSEICGLGLVGHYNLLEENIEDYDIDLSNEEFNYKFMYDVFKYKIETKNLKYVYEYSSGQDSFSVIEFSKKS